MNVDQRFSLAVEKRPGGGDLVFRATRDLEIEAGESSSRLADVGLAELLELAGAEPADRTALEAAAGGSARGTILVNGWQSWSGAREFDLDGRAPPGRAGRSILPILNIYVDGPAPRERRGEYLSYFLVMLRAGDHRLALASIGSDEVATPPLVFRVDSRGTAFRIEALAAGARFPAGRVVARIGLICREDYFAAKDALREAFGGGRRFERLAFLGRDGSLVLGGYESWYNHYTAIDELVILRDLDALDTNGNLINSYYIRRGKPTVFQVDDGWERAVGDWDPDPLKFPRGMPPIASRIEDKGLVPGLWFAPFLATRKSAVHRDHPEWILRDRRGRPIVAGWNPGWDGAFHCLDLSLPEVEDYLAALFERAVDGWGFRYLKLDFLYAAFLPGAFARGGAAFEHYDRVIGRITSRMSDASGRPVAWLGCGAPLESSYRHFPLMRIGADTKEDWDWGLARRLMHGGRPSAYVNLSHTIGRSILDGTVFVSDPDVVFCRDSRMRLSEREKELVALTDRILASQVMFSDDASQFGTEAAFTKRIVALYDRLDGAEFGAERQGSDLYRLFSRDGGMEGWINLGDRTETIGGSAAETANASEALVLRGRRVPGGLELEPRSISLFRRA